MSSRTWIKLDLNALPPLPFVFISITVSPWPFVQLEHAYRAISLIIRGNIPPVLPFSSPLRYGG